MNRRTSVSASASLALGTVAGCLSADTPNVPNESICIEGNGGASSIDGDALRNRLAVFRFDRGR